MNFGLIDILGKDVFLFKYNFPIFCNEKKNLQQKKFSILLPLIGSLDRSGPIFSAATLNRKILSFFYITSKDVVRHRLNAKENDKTFYLRPRFRFSRTIFQGKTFLSYKNAFVGSPNLSSSAPFACL